MRDRPVPPTLAARFRRLPAILCIAGALACERPAEEEAFRVDRRPPGDTGRMTAATPEARAGIMIHAALSEWRVDLSRDTIPAGVVTIMAVNRGRYRHALEVEGGGRALETAEIAPGGSAALTANLAPGRYDLYCPVRDEHGEHRALGMRTTLVVR